MGTVLENRPPPGFVLDEPAGDSPPPGFVEDRPYAPIPSLQGVPPRRPASISELTGGVVTPELASGLGGVVGTALGAGGGAVGGPMSPVSVPLAAGAGGTLGALYGRATYENLEDMLGRAGVIVREPTTMGRMGELASEELIAESAGLALGGLARPLQLTRMALGKILGVSTDRANQLIGLARQGGLVGDGGRVAMGAADVGSNIARGTARALGVFPFTGTPALRNLATKEAAASARVNSLLNELAPNSLLRNELGMELTERAGRRFRAFKRVVGRLANRLDTLARGASVREIVPTQNVRQRASEFIDQVARGNVELISGENLSDPARNRVMEFAQELTELPEMLTIDQYRETVRKLGGLMDELQGETGRRGAQFFEAGNLKRAMELDLLDIGTRRLPGREGIMQILPREEAEQIQSALRTFNHAYSRGMADFQTSTAKKFLRVDPNMFRAGAPEGGTITRDQISDIVGNLTSREGVRELEAVVGPNRVRDAGRHFIDNALRTATEQREIAGQTADVVNIDKFMRNLGLEGTRKLNREALDEFFRRAGGNLDDFEALMTAARSIERLGDPSTFVLRRTVLGGIPALAGAAGAGAAMGAGAGRTSLGAIAAMTLLFRKASDIVTSPIAMENMRVALREGIAPSARRQAMARVLTAIARSESNASAEPSQGERLRRAPSETTRSRVSPLRRLEPTLPE